MDVDRPEVEASVARLSDEELLRVLDADAGFFRAEALDCVRAEAVKRGIASDPDPNRRRPGRTGDEDLTSGDSHSDAVRPKISRKQFLKAAGMGFVAGILFTIGGIYVLAKTSEGARTAQMARELKPPVIPSQMADMNWTVRSLDGRAFNLADAKGKIVFVNFWATWCLPCRAEMASIRSLYEKVKDEDVVVVCVSQEDSSKVREFVKREGYDFPIYTLSGERPSGFETEGIPATFIVAPDGRIALQHVGAAKWDDEESVQFIRSLRPRI